MPSTQRTDTSALRKALLDSLQHRLMMQRLSGQLVPIDTHYTDVDLVDKTRRQSSTHSDISQDRAHQKKIPKPLSGEMSSSEAFVKLDQLETSLIEAPKRILIQGHAGLGKTTLSKKIASDFIHQERLSKHYAWVIWVPLYHLDAKPDSYQLSTLLYDEYFSGYLDGRDLAEALSQEIRKDPTNALFVLDRWDDVTQCSPCLMQLLNHPAAIITSRPHGVRLHQIESIDCIVETTGFNQAAITHYIDHREDGDSAAIQALIKHHPSIACLIGSPSQLEALCLSWDECQREATTPTVTRLYQGMMDKLWRKDIVRLEKKDDGVILKEEHVQELRSFQRLKRLVVAEQNCLAALSLNGLYEDRVQFKAQDVEAIIDQLERVESEPLPLMLALNLRKLSCIKVDTLSHSDEPFEYRLLHVHWQDFFAAQCLAKYFIEDKPLPFVNGHAILPDQLIQEHKYNPRYTGVLRFMAGLLQGQALQAFFKTLDAGSEDLIGIQHQQLILHCLKESDNKLSTNQQRLRTSRLSVWLHVELDKASNDSLSLLGCEDAFPESLLLNVLEKFSLWLEEEGMLIKTLGERHILSNRAVHSLVERLDHKAPEMRSWAAKALGNHITPALETHLLSLSRQEDSIIRPLMLDAFAQQATLSSQAEAYLVELSQSKHEELRYQAATILGRQALLSPETLECLFVLSSNQNEDLRESAATALACQAQLSSKAFQRLLALSIDECYIVRESVATALGHQTQLSLEAVRCLITLLKDGINYVEYHASVTLGEHKHLSPEAIDYLLQCANDENDLVRRLSVEALGNQSYLSQEAISCLIKRLQDDDCTVRAAAVNALGKQTDADCTVTPYLIPLLKDSDDSVRSSTAKVVGLQAQLSDEVVSCLIECLEDETTTVCIEAATSLARHAGQSEVAMQGLASLERWDQQLLVAEAFTKVSSHHPLAVKNLVALSKHANPHIRSLSADLLVKVSEDSSEAINCLMTLLADTESSVKEAVIRALSQAPVWRSYQLLPNLSTTLLKELYSTCLVPSNLKQVTPLYLNKNQLFFYTSEGLKSIKLHEKEGNFRKAILDSQLAVGIPTSSVINAQLGDDVTASLSPTLGFLKHRNT